MSPHSNVSGVTSLWGHSVVLWRLWLLVGSDQGTKQGTRSPIELLWTAKNIHLTNIFCCDCFLCLIVGGNGPSKGQGHLLSCCGQLKTLRYHNVPMQWERVNQEIKTFGKWRWRWKRRSGHGKELDTLVTDLQVTCQYDNVFFNVFYVLTMMMMLMTRWQLSFLWNIAPAWPHLQK